MTLSRSFPFALLALAAPALAQAPPPQLQEDAATVSRMPGQDPRLLELGDALSELEGRSLTLAEARARTEEAAGLVRQALAAAMPSLIVSGDYARNSDEAQLAVGPLLKEINPRLPAPPTVVLQQLKAFSATASVRVPVVAPSAWANTAAARGEERAASASAEAVRLELRAALVEAAWVANSGEEIVAATGRAVASADEQTRLAERALAGGTGVPLSVLQARTETVKRRSDLAGAHADLKRAQLALGVLLGRAEPVRIPLVPPPPPGARDLRSLVDEALRARPEVRATRARVEAARRQHTAAWLHLVPELSVSGSAFTQNVPLPTGKNSGWRAVADLSWSLYDGGLWWGRARQAEGATAEASAAAEAQAIRIEQEVEDAARDVSVAVERLQLAEHQAALAGETAAIARRGFVAGTSSSLDVLDANDRLYQSEVGLAQAHARFGIALAALDHAIGRS